ncbi:unnamed protein product [Rotaria magnacalcarata]|uniref:Uncharacterized protein n=1 Tax=Rotaria magnacalcarata TaxID=392030 RepID=A0A817A2L3_9BILA|nr:unnamed protein product [Rotaria magnacalcarata]CAF1649020.1 unnamed protein product [Rotaria magnacalcarata]CAF2207880.1 unnamed protein product [Rotaria magnacalcarata]CAF2227176.1 unnamed protein product [Rotaria magnacalcarata]CAF3874358.1 unnamed protein product [Rotaria magnacalcarata]
MRVSGRIVLLVVIAITAVAALFCVIGLATKSWYGSTGIFDAEYKAPAGLSIISFILLIVSVVSLVLQMFDILSGTLQLVPIILLFVATIFLLGTFVSYVERSVGSSFDLMVTAHFCSYVALAILSFWFGQSSGGAGAAN